MNWLNYFKDNQLNRTTVDDIPGVEIPERLRRPFIRSIQKFQVGESGEGTHLRRQAARTGDPEYQAAIDLFIKEEQEHARLMARVLRSLQAPLISKHWSDQCFILLRRLFGLEEELLVLLMPEIIAKRYFRALGEGLDDPALRAVFGQILHDEEGHLAFHTQYLNRTFAGLGFGRRVATQVMWRVLFRVVCAVVIIDHGSLLRRVGVTHREFWNDCGRIFDEVAAGIFTPAHLLSDPVMVRPQRAESQLA